MCVYNWTHIINQEKIVKKYHTEKRILPAINSLLAHRAEQAVFAVVNADGEVSWQCVTEESANLRCAALNFDLARGGRAAEFLVDAFLENINTGCVYN
jgi:hypothetical protein